MNSDPLRIDPKVSQLVLVGFLQNEISKSGFDHAILRVSDDISTILACFLAVAALGPDKVTALYMPPAGPTATDLAAIGSLEETLGISCQIVDAQPLVTAILGLSDSASAARRRDALARARMAILYDQASTLNATVVGSNNKSDLLLGLGTVHGDLASAINPLGDLYRSQIWKLTAYLGLRPGLSEGLIESEIVGAHLGRPIPELTYAQIDPLLYLLFDERYSPVEAAAAGFEERHISQVLTLFRRSHAQRALPLIPKLSGRTVGHDLRYLRDSHL